MGECRLHRDSRYFQHQQKYIVLIFHRMPSVHTDGVSNTEKLNIKPTLRSLSDNMSKSIVSSSDSESEFDDTHIETPIALREASKSFSDGIYVKATTTIPLRDQLVTAPTNLATPTRYHKRRAPISYSDEERELIRKQKLISENNVFSPQPQAGSSARDLRKSTFESVEITQQPTIRKDLVLEKDIEFDPSDRDLPAKPNEEQIEDVTSSKRPVINEEYRQQVTKTPQRLSPLRKEIIPSSSSAKSAAEEIASEIVRSGAFRSRSTQEIIDQINSSIDKMRKEEKLAGDDIGPEDDWEEEEEILRSLDSYLPKSDKTLLDGSPSRLRNGHVTSKTPLLNFSEKSPRPIPSETQRSSFAKTEIAAAKVIEKVKDQQKENTISEPIKPRTSKLSKRKPSTSRKLSGKYARDVLRKRKLTEPSGIYESWLYDKWDKLKRLVELSIPNNVIINNNLVLKELGCKDKDELAQRIKFLERKKQ